MATLEEKIAAAIAKTQRQLSGEPAPAPAASKPVAAPASAPAPLPVPAGRELAGAPVQTEKMPSDTEKAKAFLDQLGLTTFKKNEQVVLAMEMNVIFSATDLEGITAADMREASFPAIPSKKMLQAAQRIRKSWQMLP
jgi:hypothetical protein